MSMEQPAEQPRDSAERIMEVAVTPAPMATESAASDSTAATARASGYDETAMTAMNAISSMAAPDAGDDASSDAVNEVDTASRRQQAPPPDPRRRLRELLAIPDRDRSDALWDELIELEIQLAPGNRVPSPGNEPRQKPPGRFIPQGRRQDASGAPRQNRPHAQTVHGQNGPHHGQPGGTQGGQGVPAGAPGAARPAKRFFKKIRRNPRPAG